MNTSILPKNRVAIPSLSNFKNKIQKKKRSTNSNKMMQQTLAKFPKTLNTSTKRQKRNAVQIVEQKIQKLFSNEKNKRISKRIVGAEKVCVGFEICTSLEDRTKTYLYPGLTKKLKKIFYPQVNDQFPEAREHRHYKPKNKISHCLTSGKVHGDIVHSQLDYYIKLFAKNPNLSIDNVQFPNGPVDECTRRVIKELVNRNWAPITTEFLIFSEDIRIATAVDLLVRDLNNQKLILVELKTGYEGGQYASLPSDPMFPAPFNNIANCPKTRHFLQVMTMCEMIKRTYGVKIDEAYILRILPKENHTAHLIQVHKWAKSKRNLDALWETLELYKNVTTN